ncbi:MAG TPA: hypothetical protein VMU34_08150 [Mycobacterium sp.]|nr:hypothetical protein [Mycobacterium sp.]
MALCVSKVERVFARIVIAALSLNAGIELVHGFPPPIQPCVSWLHRTPADSPSARAGVAGAYDSTRNVTVVFGGEDSSNTLADTWEWNGTDWTQRSPTTSPLDRFYHAMTFDSGRGETLMFGGTRGSALSDTWAWNGTDWVQKSPTSSPAGRFQTAMAYDSVRGVTILFGGNDGGAGHADTWEWNGTDWTQLSPTTTPAARFAHAMTFDSARGVIVMFGGSTFVSPYTLGDTWEWNGTDWSQRSTTTSPNVRSFFGMAYDSNRRHTILFGGPGYNDTWTWDGTDWTQLTPTQDPSSLEAFAMTYDVARDVPVMFGGTDGINRLNDTYELTPLPPPTNVSVDTPAYCATAVPPTITLTAVIGNVATLHWYTGSCGGTPVGTGSPLIIPAPTSTTTYYVRSETTLCSVSNCESVTVTVNPAPTAPSSAGANQQSYCAGSTPANITLSATGGSGDTLAWYTASCGGTPVGTGTPLTIAAPNATTTYFARWETAACGNSACVSTTITVNPAPTCSVTADGGVCPGTAGLTASAATSAAAYNWSLSDGAITAGQGTSSITYTAPTSGSGFDISLTITDANQCTGSCTTTVNLLTEGCTAASSTTPTNQTNSACGAGSSACGAGAGTLVALAIPMLQIGRRRRRSSQRPGAKSNCD